MSQEQVYHDFFGVRFAQIDAPIRLKITPETADRILKDAAWEGQRRASRETVKHYAAQMKEGQWIPGGQIRVAVLDGKPYIVNGQHRLLGVVESQTTQEFTLVFDRVSDYESLAMLYSAEDRGRSRRQRDRLTAFAVHAEIGVSIEQSGDLLAAASFLSVGFSGRKAVFATTREIALIREYADAFDKYLACRSGGARYMYNPMKRRAVAGVALVTLSESTTTIGEDRVADFWRGIAEDNGLLRGDPRKLAAVHIQQTNVQGSGVTRSAQVSAPYQARYVANCFNAWAEGRTLTTTKVPDANAPIRIVGSRFKG